MASNQERQRRHDAAVKNSASTQGALTAALHALGEALGQAQPGREREWAARVESALELAKESIRHHREEVRRPDGLYDEFRFEAPWLLPRVEQLEAQLARAEREADDLASEVARVRGGDTQGIGGLRSDAERMQALFHDLLAKECDLIFERFAETPALD